MPRGPLPDPNAQRRNAATIPTTKLPADGRDGPTPEVPSWIELGQAGRAWWAWAWSTPESAGWSSSLVDVVGRRASLVDDLAALEQVVSLDALDILDGLPQEVRFLVGRLAGLVTSRLTVLKACSDLDQQLGFGAKNLAALRWTIEASAAHGAGSHPDPTERPASSRDRLKVVAGGAG